MVTGALGSTYGWGPYTLYYATTFMFNRPVRRQIAFSCAALFNNRRAEGQAMLGGLGVALACLYIPCPTGRLALFFGATAMGGCFLVPHGPRSPAFLQSPSGGQPYRITTTCFTLNCRRGTGN